MKREPRISVGIMDRRTVVGGNLDGAFAIDGFGRGSGRFSAEVTSGSIVLRNTGGRELAHAPCIKLTASDDATFTLLDVTIGDHFHWERSEKQTFQGGLTLKARGGGTMAVVNEIPVEQYLKSVISSEMNPSAPIEFLKAHAILSRSWLLAALKRRNESSHGAGTERPHPLGKLESEGAPREVIRWYDREDHDLFDVCADDHCQRYQGMTRISSDRPEEAVQSTRGMAITFNNDICDARYSKACGGLTEEFATAWESRQVPYLKSISDASVSHPPIGTEEEAMRWILSAPEANCRTTDTALLATILPDFDLETERFFRWTVDYSNGELAEILRKKSGLDFGVLRDITPLHRGPSGRISRLRILGSKADAVVGKELEIRRWLSKSHLYSSAFVVQIRRGRHGEAEAFTFHGAGWGHGVGLCQIGAAVMASRGLSAGDILKHYFPGTEIERVY